MNPVEPQYAIWNEPETSQVVKYSLPLFHELDFQVNEAYRSIPHGGVEVGGVLYGRVEAEAIIIEAFRSIACEHASGPSFHLSENDLVKMVEAFDQARSDVELKGMERVGWFVSHTRSAAEMTARETQIFDRYFPGPKKLTLVVKPERFQPTHFVFCPRRSDGQVFKGDGTSAIILPLVGRAGGSPAPLPSIAAPVKRGPAQEREHSASQATAGEVKDNPANLQVAVYGPPTTGAESMTSLDDIRRRRSEHLRSSIAGDPWRTQSAKTNEVAPRASPAGGSLILILLLASLLGCAAGYWAYLQLPPATIPLRVEKASGSVLIWWPAEQTRDSSWAEVRVNDGQPVALTSQQKTLGQIRITPNSDNTKIELVSHHRLRDSRGIVRYIQTPPPTLSPPLVDQESTAPPTATTVPER